MASSSLVLYNILDGNFNRAVVYRSLNNPSCKLNLPLPFPEILVQELETHDSFHPQSKPEKKTKDEN